ncbi:ribosomal protein RPL28 [Besnoitia besnoiti]|uniref:Ribosomal protein RPL28 n=1 Tax=Besnoitia besnoiti TaxID=94643 RepID=A0A2A9MBU5_BESBE|nr:ribosomal protein RPL28 [Besnoitia besnoiti]PFH33143.1 ribosomal protein RPL28 [Besnoitia besnoiti]
MVSSELVWQCVRRNHCFIRKFNGITLSAEPMNLTNKNTLKFSGIAHKQPLGLNRHGENGSGIALVTVQKRSRAMRKPRKAVQVRKFVKCKKEISKVTQAVAAYRPDLLKTVTKKMKKLIRTGNASNKKE